MFAPNSLSLSLLLAVDHMLVLLLLAYRTVSGVNGPLVILDDVKV